MEISDVINVNCSKKTGRKEDQIHHPTFKTVEQN